MIPDSLLQETTRFLHAQIPLTQAMEAEIVQMDSWGLRLKAPLAPNHNHLGSAFGGSLSAAATLACYSLVWLLMEDRSVHIVVKQSEIQYLHPVEGDILAFCQRPQDDEVADFRLCLATRGKARLTLNCTIEHGGRICVTFRGEFVALRK